MPDSADESDDHLYSSVKLFISELTEDEISFDTAYRLGKFKPNHRRPVRVRFLAMCQRNLIYSNRNKLTPPFYINEDLPFSIRKDHAILRSKKRDAIKSGVPTENISIDWRQRSILINLDKFAIKDGNLVLVSQSQSKQTSGISSQASASISNSANPFLSQTNSRMETT